MIPAGSAREQCKACKNGETIYKRQGLYSGCPASKDRAARMWVPGKLRRQGWKINQRPCRQEGAQRGHGQYRQFLKPPKCSGDANQSLIIGSYEKYRERQRSSATPLEVRR